MIDSIYLKPFVAAGALRDRLARQEGQALVEYALIISLIALVCIGALEFLGINVAKVFTNFASEL